MCNVVPRKGDGTRKYSKIRCNSGDLAAEAGPDGQGVEFGGGDLGVAVDRLDHDFGGRGCGQRGVVVVAGEKRHQSGASAQSCSGGEHGGAD